MMLMVETSSANAERASAGMATRPRQKSRLRIAHLLILMVRSRAQRGVSNHSHVSHPSRRALRARLRIRSEGSPDGAAAKSGIGFAEKYRGTPRNELRNRLQIRARLREPGGMADPRRSRRLLPPDGLLRDDRPHLQPHHGAHSR